MNCVVVKEPESGEDISNPSSPSVLLCTVKKSKMAGHSFLCCNCNQNITWQFKRMDSVWHCWQPQTWVIPTVAISLSVPFQQVNRRYFLCAWLLAGYSKKTQKGYEEQSSACQTSKSCEFIEGQALGHVVKWVCTVARHLLFEHVKYQCLNCLYSPCFLSEFRDPRHVFVCRPRPVITNKETTVE